jgi:tetratricopeptide (TPR) repeat protein
VKRLAVVIALAVSAPAAAGDLSAPAKQHLDAGVAAYTRGAYEDAIRELQAAYAIDPDPVLFFTWAQAERRAGRCVAALDHYERFLATGPSEEATRIVVDGIVGCQNDPAVVASRHGARGLPWYRDGAAIAVTFGVAGLAVGAGYLFAAHSASSSTATDPDQLSADLSRATTDRRIGATTMAIGGALIAAGVVYHVVRAHGSSSDHVTVSVAPSPHAALLAIGGAF